MRKIILLVLIGITLVSTYTDFCEGYRIGYKQGYCYGEQFCLSPLTPLCPLPDLGERGFQDGYNRGFLDGLNDK